MAVIAERPWTEEQKLVANDGADGNRFGNAVSLAADHALIGASGLGGAYVFARDGSGLEPGEEAPRGRGSHLRPVRLVRRLGRRPGADWSQLHRPASRCRLCLFACGRQRRRAAPPMPAATQRGRRSGRCWGCRRGLVLARDRVRERALRGRHLLRSDVCSQRALSGGAQGRWRKRRMRPGEGRGAWRDVHVRRAMHERPLHRAAFAPTATARPDAARHGRLDKNVPVGSPATEDGGCACRAASSPANGPGTWLGVAVALLLARLIRPAG